MNYICRYRLCLCCVGAWVLIAGGCGSSGRRSCDGINDCPTGQHCSADSVCVPNDTSIGDAGPGDAVKDGATDLCSNCLGDEQCVAGRCVLMSLCDDDVDCDDDTYCDDGACIPWGTGPRGDSDPLCTSMTPIGLFSPVEQCSWSGPPSGDVYPNHINVLSTPMVVDFDFDGDLLDRRPSIIFASYDRTDGGSQAQACADGAYGVIRIVDGQSCTQLYSIDAALGHVRAASPLALGDLNGDGRADIVAARCGGGLIAFSYNANNDSFERLWDAPYAASESWGGWAGPAIHDLDNDGHPEILHWGLVWSHEGALLDSSLGELGYSQGYVAVAADIDDDGVVELANGDNVWQWRSGQWQSWKTSDNARGQVALADFGTFGDDPSGDDRSQLDGIAEIAVVSWGYARIQTLGGRIVFGPVALPDGGTGGAPTAGDFDNDGRVEFAAAGSDSYTVFDPDCATGTQDAECINSEILWSKVSQDHSSSVTGSSVFDFDGDGAAEAVYADECFVRVYEGKSGDVLFSQWRSSCTWYDNPVVADVDGDYNSELIVSSNNNCGDVAQDCYDNSNYDKHPTTGETLDPLFGGLRCEDGSDCLSGRCDAGLCRCENTTQCGGDGFVCAPPKSGTSGSGDVCRAAYKGAVRGVRVYRDALDRWVDSRPIWNQHAYAVTNIDDRGLVPKTSEWQPNWQQAGLNNFRQNVQGSLGVNAAPDATARRNPYVCESGKATLAVELCNRGLQPLARGLPVTFYAQHVAQEHVICTERTEAQLEPGVCTQVSCEWTTPPQDSGTALDVYVVADDDGSGTGEHSECEEGNNTTTIKNVYCQYIY